MRKYTTYKQDTNKQNKQKNKQYLRTSCMLSRILDAFSINLPNCASVICGGVVAVIVTHIQKSNKRRFTGYNVLLVYYVLYCVFCHTSMPSKKQLNL